MHKPIHAYTQQQIADMGPGPGGGPLWVGQACVYTCVRPLAAAQGLGPGSCKVCVCTCMYEICMYVWMYVYMTLYR